MNYEEPTDVGTEVRIFFPVTFSQIPLGAIFVLNSYTEFTYGSKPTSDYTNDSAIILYDEKLEPKTKSMQLFQIEHYRDEVASILAIYKE